MKIRKNVIDLPTLFGIIALLLQCTFAQDVGDIIQGLQVIIDGQAHIIDNLAEHRRRTEIKIEEMQQKISALAYAGSKGRRKLRLKSRKLRQGKIRASALSGTVPPEAENQCPCLPQISDMIDLMALDECALGLHNCSEYAICTDRVIGFKCECLPGYSGDGFSCIEINECESGLHDCHPKAICSNTDGGYTCRCPEPFYKGDGRTCEGPFCESPGVQTRFLGCITTGRGRKKWEQAQEYCQEIGGKLLERFTPTLFEEFRAHFIDAEGQWVGIRGGKWESTGESVHPRLMEPNDNPRQCGFLRTVKTTFLEDPFQLEVANCNSHLRFICQILG
ncbi:hypothetical protein SK128_027469 [Halocaridina rubra]|uniref:EGF-like domain-containing protein n=1 Tax=Halocaridina rubra TaxID=373956 RepID=A0AAN8ZV59_HALRR